MSLKREKPIWKKSMLDGLDLGSIQNELYDMSENGDYCGYDDRDEGSYYDEFRELFNEIAAGATDLNEAIDSWRGMMDGAWDDLTVGMLGDTQHVLGFDTVERDYYRMTEPYMEDWAQDEACKRVEHWTKREMMGNFKFVLSTIVSYLDLKAASDTMLAVVAELDYRGAMLEEKTNRIDQLYSDITGKSAEQFEKELENLHFGLREVYTRGEKQTLAE